MASKEGEWITEHPNDREHILQVFGPGTADDKLKNSEITEVAKALQMPQTENKMKEALIFLFGARREGRFMCGVKLIGPYQQWIEQRNKSKQLQTGNSKLVEALRKLEGDTAAQQSQNREIWNQVRQDDVLKRQIKLQEQHTEVLRARNDALQQRHQEQDRRFLPARLTWHPNNDVLSGYITGRQQMKDDLLEQQRDLKQHLSHQQALHKNDLLPRRQAPQQQNNTLALGAPVQAPQQQNNGLAFALCGLDQAEDISILSEWNLPDHLGTQLLFHAGQQHWMSSE